MRWRRIRFWSILAVGSLLVLTWTWLLLSDFAVLTPHIERLVSEKTGREFRIAGGFSLDLGTTVIVAARNVSLSSPEWAKEPHLATLGSAEVHLNASSLFSGPVIVENAFIADLAVHLEERADGAASWDFGRTEVPEPTMDETDSSVPAVLRNVVLSNARVRYDSAFRDGPVDLAIRSLTQRLGEDDILELTASGELGGESVSISGGVGTWTSMLAGEPFEYNLTATISTLTFDSSGTVDNLFAPRQPEIAFSATGPSINDLTRIVALGESGEGNIDLEGGLSPREVGGMRLAVNGNFGAANIATRVDFEGLDAPGDIDAEIEASGPDLRRVLAIAGVEQIQSAPFELTVDLELRGSQLTITDSRLAFDATEITLAADLPEFPAAENGTATLTINGPDIARFRYLTNLPGIATGPFSGNATLDVDVDGRELYAIDLTTSQGTARASGEIRGGDAFVGTDANIAVELNDLAATLRGWEIDAGDVPPGPASISGQLKYTDSGLTTMTPLRANLLDISAQAEGDVRFADEAVLSNLTFGVEGNDLTSVTRVFTDTEFIPPKTFRLDGKLATNDATVVIENFTGAVGDAAISGTVSIKPNPRIAGSFIEFNVAGNEYPELFSHLENVTVSEGDYTISGRIDFAADDLAIRDLSVTRPTARAVANLNIGLPAERNFLKFDVEASGQDINALVRDSGPVALDTLPFAIQSSGKRDGDVIEIDALDVAIGDARLNAGGILELSETANRTSFSLDVAVPNLADLGYIDDRRMRSQSFGMQANIEGGGGLISVKDMRTTLGDSVVIGNIAYRLGDVPRLDVDVYSERLVVLPIMTEDPDDYDPEPEYEDGRLIPNVDLPFDALAKLDGSFKVKIDEYEHGRWLLRDVDLDAGLEGGALAVRNLEFRARSGYLRGNASLSPLGEGGRAELALIARDFATGTSDGNRDLAMKGDIDLNLSATGVNLRDLAASMTGILFLDIRGGKLQKNRFLQAIYGDVLDEILTTINPFAKTEPFTTIECIVAPIEITEGLWTGQPNSFVRTDKINMTLKSNIDLETEKIDLGVRSTPRKILTISAAEIVNPYVKIGGSMARPRLAVDEKGALITGGAAVATGGLSILARAAWDRLSKSQDPCSTVLEAGREALAERMPDIEPLEAAIADAATP